MNGLPYYKAYPRDFVEGTIGMPFEIKCAYRVVLDLIYMQGGQLPDDARYISGLLGCSIRKWKSIRNTLIEMGKIDVSGEFLSNKRAEKELETLAKLQDKQRENRSRPNKIKEIETPAPDHTEPEPEPYSKEPNGSLRDREKSKPKRFQEFWDKYPHRNGAKKGRGKAEAKYGRNVKAGVSEQEIIDGAIRYAEDRMVVDGYAKDPETWLNNKCWQDDIEPVSTRARDPDRDAKILRWKKLAGGQK